MGWTEHGYADGADFCSITEPTSHNNIEVGQRAAPACGFALTERRINGSVINYGRKRRSQYDLRTFGSAPFLSLPGGESRVRSAIEDSKRIICVGYKLDDVGPAID